MQVVSSPDGCSASPFILRYVGVHPECPRREWWLLQIPPQFFPCDVSSDAAIFYILVAACLCQNFLLACDRHVQGAKAFLVTQEQLAKRSPKTEVKEDYNEKP